VGTEPLVIKNHAYLPKVVEKVTPAGYATGGHAPRLRCKIPSGTVLAGQSDFKVLFSISHPELRHTSYGGKVSLNTGKDIAAFTGTFDPNTGAPTPIPLDIWSYDPTTGALKGWIRVDTSATADVLVDLYVGSGIANRFTGAAVWAGEKFKTDGLITNGRLVGGPNGSGSGSITAGIAQVVGLNGWTAIRFTAPTDVAVGTPVDISNDVCLSFWYSAEPAGASFNRIFRTFDDINPHGLEVLVKAGTLRVGVQGSGPYSSFDYASVLVDDGMWHHAAVVLNSSGCDLYFDGNYVGTVPSAVNVGVSPIKPVTFGYFDGRLSQFRIGHRKNAAWIKDERSNFINPGSYLTILSFEAMPQVVVTPVREDATNITIKGFIDEDLIQSDHNAIFQSQSKPMGERLREPVMPDHPITVDDWLGEGKEGNSKFFDPESNPQTDANVKKYLDPEKSKIPMGVGSPCCIQMWSCNGTVGADVCSDPSAVYFIQHLHDHSGPVGFSNPVIHSEVDALFTHWTYCGACDASGVLDTIPTALP
jgi:hypothetical protein